MSTRSITVVKDEDGADILTMYRQCDGYPTGHGQELVDFLKGFKVIQGISGDAQQQDKIANGAGCLAAQIVAHFKQPGDDYEMVKGKFTKIPAKSSIGQFYLTTAGQRECYNYIITVVKDGVSLRVETEAGETLFVGPVESFDGALVEAQ